MIRSVRKVIFLLLVSIGLSNAIDCYVCNSLNKADCAEIKKSTPLEPEACRVNHIGQINDEWLSELVTFNFFETTRDNPPLACQKITMMKDDKPVVYRGCVLNDGKTDLCKIIGKRAEGVDGLTVESCETCDNEDGCNKSSLLSFSLYVNASVLLIVLKLFY